MLPMTSEPTYYETLTADGTVQFVVWIEDGCLTFPVAHANEEGAQALVAAVHADSSLGRVVPMPETPDPLEPLYAHRAEPCIGIGVPEGWVPMVLEMHERVVAVCPTIQYVQVKAKFAELRVYVNGANPVAQSLIWEAEVDSRTVCEVCGGVGVPCHRRGWYRALCADHADELGYTEASP